METRLIPLKLVLDALEIPASTRTMADRKRIQKAIYLAQRFGAIDLGYRFGWYVHGPYCPALADDYYKLADSLGSGDKTPEEKRLLPEIAEKLAALKEKIYAPDDIGGLSPADWLELIASIDFLRTVSKFETDEHVAQQIQREKPHLVEHLHAARTALRGIQLTAG